MRVDFSIEVMDKTPSTPDLSFTPTGDFYTPDARFKDPFNEVSGVPAIRAIFAGMFRQVDGPRFVITRTLCQGDDAFLAWDFVFCFRGEPGRERTIRGATHIQFAADGRVALHRDYWDAAEELYRATSPTYADDAALLSGFQASEGVEIALERADETGFVATATHPAGARDFRWDSSADPPLSSVAR